MNIFRSSFMAFKLPIRMFVVFILFAALGTLIQISYSSLRWSQDTGFGFSLGRDVITQSAVLLIRNLNKTTDTPIGIQRLDSKNLSEEFVLKVIKEAPSNQFGLSDFSFLRSHGNPKKHFKHFLPMLNPLKLFPVYNANIESMPKILLVTYFRSGSSFLGDLLQQSPRTFYTFEPLHYMTDGLRIGDNMVPEAIDLLKHILKCDFQKVAHYISWGMKPENRFLFKWNTFLWNFCRYRSHLCANPVFVHDVCIRGIQHVVKLTRVHMRQIENLMQEVHDMSVKVVYLLRDPRGIYSSRKSMSWCNNTRCSDVQTLCDEIRDDFDVFMDLKRKAPDKYVLLRYEDLASDPYQTTQELFQQLGIDFSFRVQRYIATHTMTSRKNELNDPYSTKRNSQAMPLQWMQKLTKEEITKVENTCKGLQKLGYKEYRDGQVTKL